MRKIVFIIIGLFIHNYSFSQIDTTIKLIPNWKKDEIKRYEIKKYSSVDAENERKVNGLTTKTVVIQVVDIKDTVFEMNWKVEKLSFSDTINTDNPFSGLVHSLDKDISVKYIINKKGNIISILNLDEITVTVKSKVDNALNEFIKKNNIEKSKADILSFQFSMMYSTKERVEATVLSDIHKFHQIFGFSYMSDKLTIIPDNIFAPNANGQPSNNLELKFSNFDRDSKIINFEGELRCAESSQKLREFIDKSRTVKYIYKFQYPENWLISNKETLKSSGGNVNVNSTYEINLIE